MKLMQRITCIALTAVAALVAPEAVAQQALDLLTVAENGDGGRTYSVTLQVLVLMTLLSLLPAALIMMTAFTRIIVVLAILRQGLGTQQTPSNQILLGLALFLTMFVMTPVFDQVHGEAIAPYMAEELKPGEALMAAREPVRDFMVAHTREEDLLMFTRMAGLEGFNGADEIPMSLLVPAFVTSELKTAFLIGFLILIPFLIIDLVVASVLMSMGMVMLSPLIISLPFKLMLFVLVDGWSLIMTTLAGSFLV